MTEPAANPMRRGWWKFWVVAGSSVLLLTLASLWYVNTAFFQALVRGRVVSEIERITGGRAEIGSFHTIPFRMQVELRDVTVHGRESEKDLPLAHVDHLVAFIKVGSLIRPQLGFHNVVVEHPVIHVAFYSDGTTNIPRPLIAHPGSQTSIEEVFSLSINHFEMRKGELLWDDQTVPLDNAVENAALHMDYSFLRGRYEGDLLLGKVDTKFDGFRPFAWLTTAEFSLGPTFADVKSLSLSSGRSSLRAKGRVSDFRHPLVDCTYQAHLDLGEIAEVVRRLDLRGGAVDMKGQGRWSLQQFETSGELALHNLGWRDQHFNAERVDASAEYSLNDRQIKVSKMQAKILGGVISGDAEINHWLTDSVPEAQRSQSAVSKTGQNARSRIEANQKAKLLEPQTGLLHLRWRDLSAQESMAAATSFTHSLRGLRPAGVASGNLEAFWKGSFRNTEVRFAGDLNPPVHPAPNQLPIEAHVEGAYRAAIQELQLPKFHLTTPNTHVQASGTVSTSSSLRVSISTSNLEEWNPLIAALHGSGSIPWSGNGGATFNGVVAGSPSSPTLAGSLLVEDFKILLPATARAAEKSVHWDRLSTSVQVSSHAFAFRGGNLQHGTETADFDFTGGLQDWRFTDASAFALQLRLHNTDIAAVQALAGYDYPITGKADVSMQASGTPSDPQGQGKISVTAGSVYGEPFDRLDANLHLAHGEVALDGIRLGHYDSVVTGSAAYNPSSRGFRLDLTGKNFDLAQVRQLRFDRLKIEGRADITVKGSGTIGAPNLDTSLHVHGLTLDNELAGDLDLEAVTTGDEMHITGSSQFQQGTLKLDGNVHMRGEYPATVSLGMDHLDLDSLLRSYLHGQITGHSAVAGKLQMRGPLLKPGMWAVDGNLSEVLLDVEYAKVHNDGPVRFLFANHALQLEKLHLLGEGTDLTAHGSVQLSGSREIDFAADGRLDLKLLNTMSPDFTAGGWMTVNMTVGGTTSDLLPQGHLQLSNGSLAYAGLPSGLSEMNGSLIFTRDRVHIESLSARTGGGTLDLKGDATSYRQQLSFNITATGRGVRLRYPPGVSSTADADVHWVGTRNASIVSGDITVTKLAVTPGFDFSSYLERSRQIAAITPANSPLYNVKLDLHVQTAPELQMKTAIARLSGDADLRLRGSVAAPIVLGRADILEGEATFNGTKFRLERGEITFANPVAIEPRVDLEASTHVRNYDLNVTVTGIPERLNVNYRSEPPLPQSDIISLLALGRTSQESEQLQQQSGQSQFTDTASAMILNQALNATVTNRIQRLFGVSRIKIDPQGLSTETNPTARGPQVTIDQEFANNLSLSYSTNVSQSSQQIIRGEYYFTRDISAVGTRDQNGVVSFDVRVRRRKK